MPANTNPIFVLTPNLAEVTFTSADTTSSKDLITGGSNGTKVLGISATSSDSATINMRLYVHDGSTAYLVGTVAIVTNSGTNGTAPAVDLLSMSALPWLDSDGEFLLPSGYKLQVACLATMTTGTCTIVCFGGDY